MQIFIMENEKELLSIESLSTLDEMQAAYNKMQKELEESTKSLEEHIIERPQLDAKIKGICKMEPFLDLLECDSDRLCSQTNFVCDLAENISSKVRQLDLAKNHVFEAIQRVDDILDLKFCTDGVKTAMESNDYEQAAANIHRYLCLDENVIQQSIIAGMESSTINASLTVLREARVQMSKVVSEQFDLAVKEGDLTAVERFFKIFPLLKKEEEGLEKFAKFLRQEIAKSSQENLKLALKLDSNDRRFHVLFADTLTLLFEGIARTVEKQQPLVETYYGPGKLFMLVKNLQQECDIQARYVLDKFESFRKFKWKIQQVQNAFVNRGRSADDLNRKSFDPRDIEPLLAEVTLISARCELYLRFLRRRVQADIDIVYQTEEEKKENKSELLKWVTNCDLSHKMQEIVGGYILMEEYYMRESASKAIQLDTIEEGSLTSSMVDDTFFILKQCIKRAMTSSSIDCVCAMLNHAASVLDSDFRSVLTTRIKAGFSSGGMLDNISSAYNVMQTSLQQGKLGSVDEQNAMARQMFITTLNNCDVASQHVQTLKRSLEAEVFKVFVKLPKQDLAKLESCFSDLVALSSNFKDLLEAGVTELSSSCIKPEIRPLITNFLSVSHILSESDFATYEANDPWAEQLIYALQQLTDKFHEALSSMIYDQLISHLTNEIAIQLEKVVFKSTFNRLGGMQFDKELRSLVSFLTTTTTWTVRDRFARLTQTATILNLDRVDEILDYWGHNSGPLTWRLTPAEVRRVLALRADFGSDEICKLKL
uniref:conserved oligomeric Golgi complex subunit 4-like n=1 Tax=Styela clava TaxID=7725 RepID=UPI00193AC023|nr:conserved oligomeric Golgi complex subunit 4-like [Styela clava]